MCCGFLQPDSLAVKLDSVQFQSGFAARRQSWSAAARASFSVPPFRPEHGLGALEQSAHAFGRAVGQPVDRSKFAPPEV
jgi:hypothetical protein